MAFPESFLHMLTKLNVQQKLESKENFKGMDLSKRISTGHRGDKGHSFQTEMIAEIFF